MSTLNQLFVSIGGTDKHSRHDLGFLYGPLLKHKSLTAQKVIEIGVGSTKPGSLIAFGQFFSQASVWGIDKINHQQTSFEPNIFFKLGNAYDRNWMDTTLGNEESWDIVIDDGSHKKEDQLWCLEYFKDKLAPNGIILIEDVREPSIDYIYDNFGGNGHYLSVIDRMRCPRTSEFKDDYIIMYYRE